MSNLLSKRGRCKICNKKLVLKQSRRSGNYYYNKFCEKHRNGKGKVPKNLYSNLKIIKKSYPHLIAFLKSKRDPGQGIVIKCASCGHKKRSDCSRPIRKVGLRFKCKCKHRLTVFREAYPKELKRLKKKVTPLEDYAGANKPIKHQCNVCGYVWKTNPLNMKLYGCPACSWDRKKEWNGTRKKITIGGRKFVVQGYEPYALKYIFNKVKVFEKLFVTVSEGKPTLRYKYKGKYRVYIPDFIYKDILVEVKSLYTLGINNKEWFEKNKRKAKAAIKAGYRYKLLVFTRKGRVLKMPSNWYNLSHRKVFKHLKRD
jgi:hypothetical protein